MLFLTVLFVNIKRHARGGLAQATDLTACA